MRQILKVKQCKKGRVNAREGGRAEGAARGEVQARVLPAAGQRVHEDVGEANDRSARLTGGTGRGACLERSPRETAVPGPDRKA